MGFYLDPIQELMKQLISIVILVIGIGFGSVEAIACTCDLPPRHKSQRQLVTSARKSSQAVFSGVVLKTDEVGISLVRVTFKVEAFWKGPLPAEVIEWPW